MNTLKEFHLVARTIYSFLAVLAFMGVTGLSFSMVMLKVGLLVFVNSFLLQYFVLHSALKKITVTPRGRLFFLIGWWVFCVAGIVGSAMMTPQLQDLYLNASIEDVEEFSGKAVLWSSVFIVFSAALVAMDCARRAFTRYEALG